MKAAAALALAARLVAVALPALVVVIFAGALGFLALGLDTGRRQYALDFFDRSVRLAAVLVSGPQRSPADP